MAQRPPRRVIVLEWKVPPHCARKLLQHCREFVTNNVDAEFTQMHHKRAPREPKLQTNHRTAIAALRLIAGRTGTGAALHMRKVAHNALKEIT